MASNVEQSVSECAAQIQLLYNRLDASFHSSDDQEPTSPATRYLRIVGEIDALQGSFDTFARLVKQLPECSDDVQRCKAQVAVIYGRFCSLQYDFSKKMDAEISEPDKLTSEEKEDSPEEPDAPEDVDPDAEEAVPVEENSDDDSEEKKEKKRKKKKQAQERERHLQEAQHAAYLKQIQQQEAAERQRQEARRAAASAISGQTNPDRPWSEADIRMEEARRADEQRQREQRESENRRMEQEKPDAYQQRRSKPRAMNSLLGISICRLAPNGQEGSQKAPHTNPRLKKSKTRPGQNKKIPARKISPRILHRK